MNKDNRSTLLKGIYGQNIGPAQSQKAFLIENPELLKLSQNQNGVDIGDVEVESSLTNGASRAANAPKRGPTDKQLEMRTSDGRRRITPMFIMPNAETSNHAITNGNSGNSSESFGKFQMLSSSSESKSKIRVEKLDGVVEPNVSPGKKTNDKPPTAETVSKPNMIAVKHKLGPVNSSTSAVAATNGKLVGPPGDSGGTQLPKVNMIQVKKAPGKPPAVEQTVKKQTEKVRRAIAVLCLGVYTIDVGSDLTGLYTTRN